MIYYKIKFWYLIIIYLNIIIVFSPVHAEEIFRSVDTAIPIVIKAEYVKYTEDNETVYARGKVRVTYSSDTLRADELWFSFPTKLLHAKGNVKLIRGTYGKITAIRLECEELTYELDSYRGIAKKTYTNLPPWFIYSPEIEQLNRFEQHVREASFTTCDRPEPHYHLTAKEIIIYPDKYIMAKNVWFYVKNVPILYYPSYRKSLTKHTANFSITPGHNSRHGIFIKTAYNLSLSDRFLTRWHLDYFSRQGLGYGLDAEYTDTTNHNVRLASYYVDERETDEDRTRFYLRHRSKLTDSISVLSYADYASDPEFDEDYIWKYIRGKLDSREIYTSFQNLQDTYVLRLTVRRYDEAIADESGIKHFELSEQQTPQLELHTKYQKLGRFNYYWLWKSSVDQNEYPGTDLVNNSDNYSAMNISAGPEIIHSRQLFKNLIYTSTYGLENSWSSKTSNNAIYDEYQVRLYHDKNLRYRISDNLKTDIYWRTTKRLDDPEDPEYDRTESSILGSRVTYRVPKTKLRLNWLTAYSLKDKTDSNPNDIRYSTRVDASWQPRNNLILYASGELLNQYLDDSVGNRDTITGQTWFASATYYPKDWFWVSLGAKYQNNSYPNENFGQSTESFAFYPGLGTNLGSKWKLQLGAGYEIGKSEGHDQTFDTLYKQVILIRDLHCWEAYLRYQEWEDGSSWWFALNLKAYPIKSISFDQKAVLF
ncbi:MAG: hypothetical protein N3A72_03105 [bacterium]|nr:hypothetical protein [bacterium]